MYEENRIHFFIARAFAYYTMNSKELFHYLHHFHYTSYEIHFIINENFRACLR